ncbi:alkaline phosphatase family protein [Pelomyxa schiedti]|nr:alkaline phosphatase family protein [Pelomyxa schiedti]
MVCSQERCFVSWLVVPAFLATAFGTGLIIYALTLGNTKEYTPASTQPTVVVVSVDAFRYDYIDGRANIPNLKRVYEPGVKAEMTTSVFPSSTFPNHYSIVTGLYPASSGIVYNTMYDPVWDAWFRISDSSALEPRWWNGEPIWATAESQGIKTGTFFWPGSEVPINGVQPTYWVSYNSSVPYSQRVDTVLQWLALPADERPYLVFLYLEGVDSYGHTYGPDSFEVVRAIEEADTAIGRLLDGLESLSQASSVNMIVLSDHGMAQIMPERTIFPRQCTTIADEEVIVWSPILQLRPNNITAMLNGLTGCHPSLDIYLQEDLPEHFHFTGNRRITPLVGVAQPGWTVSSTYSTPNSGGGVHGYDPETTDMHGIFFAKGPAFKVSTFIPTVSVLDIHNTLAEILNIRPAPNNGTTTLSQTSLLN